MNSRQRRTALVVAVVSAALWLAVPISTALFADGADRVDEGVDVRTLYLTVLATLSTLATAVMVARWWRAPSETGPRDGSRDDQPRRRASR
ncbi:hypothetical protein DQ244_15385 [Blastococcus sp. TBT05-19]|uniref:hypothetical protein n=1 Tax=Blastococcus sp. TBT05-19 TaxID=2250581 RepID=UPI000DEBCDD3|nr:hypothetical protein [Blastococcus sp. TBT05-19]RBY89137.1 hypothetical protein DQ244_15385 [Blastococcus sp. TBT05-19]